VNTWRQAWACVNCRPRSNLGLIVDAFNSLAREYADPYTPSGLQRSVSASSVYLKRHLADLRTTVPGNKIFLFQIADAGLPPAGTSLAIPPPPESGIPRLQQWSRNCRLFPLETSKGAYLPVTQYARTVLATGYTGDLSLEVFNASLHLPDADVPRQHAVRGFEALKRLSATLTPSEGAMCTGIFELGFKLLLTAFVYLQAYSSQRRRRQNQRRQIFFHPNRK
jgi:4-hydroxyphenylpyruvate dioxygenase